MRGHAISRVFLNALLMGTGIAVLPVSSALAERPRVFAITSARVIVAPGQVIEEGTVVLRDGLIEAVGKDATRYFFLQSSADRQLDFDLELAVQQSNENPVYYVQSAHARIASILRTAAERDITSDLGDVALLSEKGELDLVRLALRLPELVDDIRQHYGVHQLTTFALELAGAFHGFYRDHRVVDEADAPRSKARLRLVQAVQVALRQTLGLLGVNSPDKM